jgi:hypothetical protein
MKSQVLELLAALQISKAHLAKLLCISPKTLQDWLAGTVSSPECERHLARVSALLKQEGVASYETPLSPRFGRTPLHPDGVSLLDALCIKSFDESLAASLLREAKKRSALARQEQQVRDERLRAAGFEELDLEQRKRILATNMALRAPLPPEQLVDALQDRIHPTSGRLLQATKITKHN